MKVYNLWKKIKNVKENLILPESLHGLKLEKRQKLKCNCAGMCLDIKPRM